MQASMFLVDGLRPGTVRVWQQARASGGTIEGIEVTEPNGDYVQLHCADLDQIEAIGKTILAQVAALKGEPPVAAHVVGEAEIQDGFGKQLGV